MVDNLFDVAKTSKRCSVCTGWLLYKKARRGTHPRHLPDINGKKAREFYECPHCGSVFPGERKNSGVAFCL